MDPLIGRMVESYLVIGILGRGGMGAVYRALDPSIGLQVALKVLTVGPEWANHLDALYGQFHDEARALARVNHPAVVRVYRYGEVSGSPYMTMELIEGARSLADAMDAHIAAGDWFSRAEIRRILDELLDGLAAVHKAGVLHRDVKPENILLQPVQGRPSLIRFVDFGVATLLGTGEVKGDLAGTPEYMAPEQLDEGEIGPWSDLYAVGVVAYELLTDRRPFPFDKRSQLFEAKADPHYDPTTPLRGGGYPLQLLTFLGQALAHRRDDRYQTVSALRAELHQALEALEQVDVQRVVGGGDASARAFDSWLQAENQRLSAARVALARTRLSKVATDPGVERPESPTPMLQEPDEP